MIFYSLLCTLDDVLYFVHLLLDPVSIGFDVENEFRMFPFIIPDGNVVNYRPPLQPQFKRGLLSPFSVLLVCYSIRGHENPVWEIPNNSSFNPVLPITSPYRSVLIIISSLTAVSVERFVCRSPNNVSSSVIVINSKLTIIIF